MEPRLPLSEIASLRESLRPVLLGQGKRVMMILYGSIECDL